MATSKNCYVMTVGELCAEIRARVSAQDAAYKYGLTHSPRQALAYCPWHRDAHASLHVYGGTDARGGHGSGYYCFACGAGGDVIALTAKVLNLATMDAIRQLDADFNLHLPLTPQPQAASANRDAERAARAQHREMLEAWRRETMNALDAEIQLANNLPPTPETWTPEQRRALMRREYNQYYSDLLLYADVGELETLYDQREREREGKA